MIWGAPCQAFLAAREKRLFCVADHVDHGDGIIFLGCDLHSLWSSSCREPCCHVAEVEGLRNCFAQTDEALSGGLQFSTVSIVYPLVVSPLHVEMSTTYHSQVQNTVLMPRESNISKCAKEENYFMNPNRRSLSSVSFISSIMTLLKWSALSR